MKIYVVGIGPGNPEHMTERATLALKDSQVIAGYDKYIELVDSLIQGKEIIKTPMKGEEERCLAAVEAAVSGKRVAVICSGDAGVYGMAGLIYKFAQPYGDLEIEIVPGVTAALSAGALLGAPLIHDFAVISLSDLLTPWETIEMRLACAARADFVICLYNPASKKRKDYLERACTIIGAHRDIDVWCGTVRNAGREGEVVKVMKLSRLKAEEVDMFTTVFIGNSTTTNMGGKLVTARGYPTETAPEGKGRP